MIIQLIDNNNRLVIPKILREAIGVTDKVKIELVDGQIVISNPNGMRTQAEIEQMYKNIRNLENRSDYDKGFEDALKMILNK